MNKRLFRALRFSGLMLFVGGSGILLALFVTWCFESFPAVLKGMLVALPTAFIYWRTREPIVKFLNEKTLSTILRVTGIVVSVGLAAALLAFFIGWFFELFPRQWDYRLRFPWAAVFLVYFSVFFIYLLICRKLYFSQLASVVKLALIACVAQFPVLFSLVAFNATRIVALSDSVSGLDNSLLNLKREQVGKPKTEPFFLTDAIVEMSELRAELKQVSQEIRELQTMKQGLEKTGNEPGGEPARSKKEWAPFD